MQYLALRDEQNIARRFLEVVEFQMSLASPRTANPERSERD